MKLKMSIWKLIFLELCVLGMYGSNAVYRPFGCKEYIPMEAVSATIVYGGTRNGGRILGVLAVVDGVKGKALSLDGSSVIHLGSARSSCFLTPDLCPEGFTLAFWLYDSGGTNGLHYFISSGGHADTSHGVAISRHPNGVSFDVKTRQQWLTSTVALNKLPRNTWNHVVLTWKHNPVSPVSSSKIYINGVLVSLTSTIKTVPFPGTTSYNLIYLGSSNSGTAQDRSTAVMDELLFWDEVKDGYFVRDLYNVYTDFHLHLGLVAQRQFLKKDNQSVTSGIFRVVLNIYEVNCVMECLRSELCLGVNWKESKKCELFNVVYAAGVYQTEEGSYIHYKI